MRKLFCFSFIWLLAFLSENSFGHFTGKGHVHTVSETKQDFLNSDCRPTASCDLKRFTLTTSVYEVWFSDDPIYPTYGNSVVMEYQTDSVAALERYAIVQFKKGCVFYSSKTNGGKITRKINDTVPSFGENVPFCFPEWVIDSQDTDPAYNSDPKGGRFSLLRWNRPGSYDERTQKFYGIQKPRRPVVYMADHPSGAFVSEIGMKNVALEFNTCIYKASEVPEETRREDINFATPLTCFGWQNVYVYDFDRGKFQTDIANLPRWEEPSARLEERQETPARIDLYLMVILVTLFIALALLIFTALSNFLRQKDSRHP
ncbi:MAG TPA: hypothetical protein VFS81_04670 [Candidatus Binatia bacterium]|nr:hypothetical protein [Candidatus Binatia bacterium]HYQ97622.1 hypothetical protein [Candidatus Nitrosocosmicus sp.]